MQMHDCMAAFCDFLCFLFGKVGSTVRTLDCFNVNLRLAERADLCSRFWSRCRCWFVQPIDALDDKENNECGQQKLNNDLDEVSVCDDRSGCFLRCAEGRIAVAVKGDQHVCEIDFSSDECDDRHDNVIDKRTDDVVECTADDNADCHINYIAAHDEFLEFVYKCFHGFLL